MLCLAPLRDSLAGMLGGRRV